MESQSDITSLICSFRAGDESAKAELLTHFRDYLRLLARLHVRPLLHSKFDDSDIVQETCVEAFAQMHTFRGETEKELAAWLRKILANKGAWMARKYRTEKRDVLIEQQLYQDLDRSAVFLTKLATDSGSTPARIAEKNEQSVLVAKAIAKLPRDQRTVVMMRGIQGVSVAEIARRLDRSEGSTWKLWARGLQSLRDATRTVS